jgi:hypothetical protein
MPGKAVAAKAAQSEVCAQAAPLADNSAPRINVVFNFSFCMDDIPYDGCS